MLPPKIKIFRCCHCIKEIKEYLILPNCENHLCDECIYFILETSYSHIFTVGTSFQKKINN